MRGYTFYQRASRAFQDYPSLSKLVVVFTVSSGGLVAFSDAKPFRGAYADAVQCDRKKKKVVSPRNYFAFTPLLPSVTIGTVEARSVVEPIRNIVRKYHGLHHCRVSMFPRLQSASEKDFDVQFREAECLRIDAKNKKVYCQSNQESNLGGKEEFTVDYDYLVIAMGARSNTFNTPGVVENCHFLKEVEDAQRIRRTVIDCFERASLPSVSEEEKKKILHFVVVGGGPTGVEFAAELHDFVVEDLAKLYPAVKDHVKITLLEAGDHILNMFDKRITAFAEEKFQRDGISVKTGSMVIKVTDKEISTKERKTGETLSVPYGMVVWSTGIGTRPVIMEFMKQIGQGNAQKESTELNIEGFKSALSEVDSQMKNLPATAQVAAQQGAYLANCFNRMDECEKHPEGPMRIRGSGHHRFRPFRYKHLGQFAPLGGEQAAAQLPGDWVSIGHSTQWLWYSVYASKLVSWRTRMLVISDWGKRFIFGRDSSRI
ncbi:hypothetical protein F0562_016917 [Nyssa sinensis]|uniref:NADH:ubiquinone reductase (non-electrogenic) n=1 Tax=Nyssa sinensis TaxID=561372 RepID=A0A5J4ZH87_9ASTE|nr:hypothetical protein F0562_016917 [Nyssa sinensis]